MIKVYVMQTCPDCAAVKQQAMSDPRLQLIDIGEQAKNLKQFLNLRDTNTAFDKVRQRGNIGIPCFIFPDGTITFSTEKANLMLKDMSIPITHEEENTEENQSCSIDGSGC